MLPEFIMKLLHTIAKDQGFIDYKIDTKSGSNDGDNFLGVLTAVILSGTKAGKSEPEELHLLCKMPPMSKEQRKGLNTDCVFDREVCIYSELLPKFDAFQREKNLNDDESFISYPKAFASVYDEENETHVIIMEDLRPKNYKMWPKEKTVPVDHMMRVMKELGKFHAISFAMKDQRPHEFAKFKKLNDLFNAIAIKGAYGSFIHISVVDAAEVLHNQRQKKHMLELSKSYPKMVEDFFDLDIHEKFGVVGHGVCVISK